ncbi:MAG TPA: hypothetical protein PLP30_04400 [Clostridia bacterium]|nr:hypothetical protein [Clostridia bacterium]
MSDKKIGTWYYQQFDADYNLEVPAEGYGGWKKIDLPIELDKTALVVMHAWDCGTRQQYPGWYRAVEYIERANEISDQIFPLLLKKARNNNIPVLHVADDSGYADDFKGHTMAIELCKKYYGDSNVSSPVVPESRIHSYLRDFKRDFSFPGKGNIPDIDNGQAVKGFMKNAMPVNDEFVATDSEQLNSICLELGINHLIYTGFAINWCLQYSPGNMNDMASRGLLCSTIREAVTAVENKSSAATQSHKEYALWVTSLKNGFVYDLDDFIRCIDQG